MRIVALFCVALASATTVKELEDSIDWADNIQGTKQQKYLLRYFQAGDDEPTSASRIHELLQLTKTNSLAELKASGFRVTTDFRGVCHTVTRGRLYYEDGVLYCPYNMTPQHLNEIMDVILGFV